MARRQTPAARALVGVLALRDGATINRAFELAGYRLLRTYPLEELKPWSERTQLADVRTVLRRGRRVKTTLTAGAAISWLERLGRKLQALGVGKAAA